jgi:hypothetical protein
MYGRVTKADSKRTGQEGAVTPSWPESGLANFGMTGNATPNYHNSGVIT